MNEGQKEPQWIIKPGELNPFKDYYTVSERKTDQGLISITTNGLEISEEQADRLINNTHKAAQIANQINQGPIKGYKEKLILRFPAEGQVGLMNDLKARKELLDEDDESQTAAVVHEMIHSIEEELDSPDYYNHNLQEAVPLAAEFIFGGKSRLPFFVKLTDKVITHTKEHQDLDPHSRGWKKALYLLQEATDVEFNLTNESGGSITNRLIQLRDDLEEHEKIALIQDFIEQGIRN